MSTVNLLIIGGGGGGFYSDGEDTKISFGKGGRGGKGFLAGGEGGEHIRVVLEVGVVLVLVVRYLEAVEGTLGEVEVRIKIFLVGEGEVLSTTEQIRKMNVVIILLDMVK